MDVQSCHGPTTVIPTHLSDFPAINAGLAHELGNHLQVIASAIRLIEREGSAGAIPLERSPLRSAMASVERAALLTRRIFAQSETRDRDDRITCLNAAIKTLAEPVALVVGQSIAVDLQLDAQAPLILCDPQELEDVILNLAINARDAMPDGGRLTLSIDVETTASGAVRAIVRISDTGEGMTAEVRRRAFEPLFTTKGDGGTGLGLAAVSDFARRMGGTVAIEDNAPRGTSITLRLPACL